jgi:hypothetical protein
MLEYLLLHEDDLTRPRRTNQRLTDARETHYALYGRALVWVGPECWDWGTKTYPLPVFCIALRKPVFYGKPLYLLGNDGQEYEYVEHAEKLVSYGLASSSLDLYAA